jgi:hypothetical protein
MAINSCKNISNLVMFRPNATSNDALNILYEQYTKIIISLAVKRWRMEAMFITAFWT